MPVIPIADIADVHILVGMNARPAVKDFLPLPLASFHILLSLAHGDRHGYAIIQDVAARTGGDVQLSAGTLYRSIQRMLEQGLIIEVRPRRVSLREDERRRYYRISSFGRQVARAETEQLERLVRLARAGGLAPGMA